MLFCCLFFFVSFSFVAADFDRSAYDEPRSGFSVSDRVEVVDTVVWDAGFYSVDGVAWTQFSLFGNRLEGSWVIGEATISPVSSSARYFAVFSCSWSEGWDCSSTWQVLDRGALDEGSELVGEYLDSVEGDWQALMDLYAVTQGDNWFYNNGWGGPPESMGEWWGVATDEDGRVVHLDLQTGSTGITTSDATPSEYGNNLTNAELVEGSWELIPGHELRDSIGNLQRLEYLNLKHNTLRGPVPEGITNLVRAKRILLTGHPREPQYGSGTAAPGNHPTATGIPSSEGVSKAAQALNFFEGSIPEGVGSLEDLEIFELAFSGVSGSIPEQFGDLPELRMLLVHGNDLSGPLPASIGNAAQLRYLFAHGNDLSGSIPPELGALADMKHLRISGNSFTGVIPEELGNIHDLRSVFLSNNDYDEQPFPAFLLPAEGHNTRLNTVYLGNSNLVGPLPEVDVSVIETNRFNHLSWGNNALSGPIPNWVTQHDMIILTLHTNNFEGPLPEGFFDNDAPMYSRLRNLYLYRNDLSGSLPAVDFGPMIRNIFFYENDFSGSIPAKWGDIETAGRGTGLSVRLHRNRLSGYIPPEVADITMIEPGKLLTFDISSNDFSESDITDFRSALLMNHPDVDFSS